MTSAWVAPLLTARLRRTTVLGIVLPLLGADLVVAGIFVMGTAALIVCVIVGGMMLGILNTVLTESVIAAILVVAGRRLLSRVNGEVETPTQEAEAIGVGEAA